MEIREQDYQGTLETGDHVQVEKMGKLENKINQNHDKKSKTKLWNNKTKGQWRLVNLKNTGNKTIQELEIQGTLEMREQTGARTFQAEVGSNLHGNKGTRKQGNKELEELKPGNWETWECW